MLETNVERLAKTLDLLMETVEKLIDAVTKQHTGTRSDDLWKTWRRR